MDKRKAKTDTGLSSKLLDPRPLKDKEFQIKTTRSLIKYLVLHNYPYPISQSLFLSGDMQVFKEVSEYLLRQIDSSLTYSTEKDLLDILKSINYPYPIHSHFFSGASNYFHYLLGILEWLLKIVADLETKNEENVFMDYFTNAYVLFLQDKPLNSLRFRFEQQVQEYLRKLEVKLDTVVNNVKELKKVKKDIKTFSFEEVEENLQKKLNELEQEKLINCKADEDLRLYLAYYDDFQKEIDRFMPGGILTLEQYQNLVHNDEGYNSKNLQISLEIDEMKAEILKLYEEFGENNKELKFETDTNEEGNSGFDLENEMDEVQESIDFCRRENYYLMEEIEVIDEKIHKMQQEITVLENFHKNQEKEYKSNFRLELNEIINHCNKIKQLLSAE